MHARSSSAQIEPPLKKRNCKELLNQKDYTYLHKDSLLEAAKEKGNDINRKLKKKWNLPWSSGDTGDHNKQASVKAVVSRKGRAIFFLRANNDFQNFGFAIYKN